MPPLRNLLPEFVPSSSALNDGFCPLLSAGYRHRAEAGIVCFAGRKDADIGEFQYLETSQSLIGTVYIALAEHPAAADETVVIEHIGAEMPFSAVKYRYVLLYLTVSAAW